MAAWFQTWERGEYKEWATPITEGYLLVIMRREQDVYLCVKAKLRMGEKGLPEFTVLEQLHQRNQKDAITQMTKWKKENS